MYHRGGDRGWHQGHHQRDVFPPRNHQPAPYRGGYQDQREHNNYGQYDHNECHDRTYNDNQYMDYQEPTYHDFHEENRPYHDHRDSRDQAYHPRGRHDGGYQKDFRGGYQQTRGESSRYHNVSKSQRKKYPYKGFKPQLKEIDIRTKTNTSKPVQPVVHYPVRSGGSSQNTNEAKSVPSHQTAKFEQQDEKAVQESTKFGDHNKKPTQDEIKVVQNKAKATENQEIPEQGIAEPSEEDTDVCGEDINSSEERIMSLNKEVHPAKEGMKIENPDTSTEMHKDSGEPVCDTKPSTMELTAQLSCKIEPMEDSKDIQILPIIKEEKHEFSISGDETQEENFFGKRIRSQDEDHFFTNKTVEIPLLGGWTEIPSDSLETTATSARRQPEPVVTYRPSHTAHELRKAFILAKKEELELAFSQDCRTFAFVANTLLKKDPSLEVGVSNALRSTLQEIAGRCVQELSKFIDHYDNIPVNISERLQNSEM